MGKQRSTFAKLSRETKTQERKFAKEARKRQRREEIDRANSEGRSPWAEPDDVEDTAPVRLDINSL